MSVELQVRLMADHLAAYKEAVVDAIEGRAHLWDMVDAAADEAYENAVKGTAITAVDSALDSVVINSTTNSWFQQHQAYFASIAGISGVTSVKTAIDYYGWRVHEYFDDLFRSFSGQHLSLPQIYPAQITLYQLTDSGSPAVVAGETPDLTKYAYGIIAAQNLQIQGATAFNLTANLVRANDTEAEFEFEWTNGNAANTVRYAGRYTLTAEYDTGTDDGVVTIGTHAAVAGDRVLLSGTVSGTLQQQVVEVTAVGATTITCRNIGGSAAGGIRWAFPIGGTATILFKGFSETTPLTRNTGNSGDEADFYFAEDRAISLA
jgi:hypothetical protein